MAFTNQFLQLTLCLALVLVVAHSRPLDHESVSMRERHEQWMAKHGRVYKDEAEKEKRFNIFKENVKRIEEFNRRNSAEGKHLYKLGVNGFTDLTTEEFQATHTGHKSQPPSPWSNLGTSNTTKFRYESLDDVPSMVDWRHMGAVTPVKDQEKCGCCWAFAVVATIEGINQIRTGQLLSFSEQELLDCDASNNGCDGGNKNLAYGYVEKYGLTSEEEYSYQGLQGQCQASFHNSKVTISNYEQVPENDEIALMKAVSQQPVAVSIESNFYLKHYPGGIFDGPCGQDLNHAVTIVGYGSDPTTRADYWLIKNSWGEDWGENGYVRMLRGQNMCGLAIRPSFPTM